MELNALLGQPVALPSLPRTVALLMLALPSLVTCSCKVVPSPTRTVAGVAWIWPCSPTPLTWVSCTVKLVLLADSSTLDACREAACAVLAAGRYSAEPSSCSRTW